MPIEKLTWILDKINPPNGRYDEALYQQNIDFVHSLGLKCDCVGWCEIILGKPETEKILNAIAVFCETNGWTARGWYEVSYTDLESDWFELLPSYFKDHTVADRYTIPCVGNKQDTLLKIHAYRENAVSPKDYCRTTYVPLRFVEVCKSIGLKDVDFCWLCDVGKYAAEQYFAIYPSQNIAHIGVDWKVRRKGLFGSEIDAWKYKAEDKKIVDEMSGWLSKISGIFSELNIRLPDCYLKKDLPQSGIAVAYYEGKEVFYSRKTILVHRTLAKKLIETKALSEKYLSPALVSDRLPSGYMLIDAALPLQPTPEFIAKNSSEYHAFLQQPRPVRQVSEKDALKLLRASKREEKENYQKAIPKAKGLELIGTAHEVLLPFYFIANGGYLSDEYELLCYTASLKASEEFEAEIQKEELWDEKPKGIVIAKCADGDAVLLLTNGIVERYSHEEPVAIEAWRNLSQFVFEALMDR